MFVFLAASLLQKVQVIWQEPGGDNLKSFSKLFIRLATFLSNRQGDRQTFKTLKPLKGRKSLMTFLQAQHVCSVVWLCWWEFLLFFFSKWKINNKWYVWGWFSRSSLKAGLEAAAYQHLLVIEEVSWRSPWAGRNYESTLWFVMKDWVWNTKWKCNGICLILVRSQKACTVLPCNTITWCYHEAFFA